VGLLLLHKSTKVRVYADRVEFAQEGAIPQMAGERGVVSGFSRASRKRMFDLLHELEFERATFVTLTYGGDYPADGRKIKRHLKEYRRRFEKRFGCVPAVWRMELQRRGAAHFHIMYLDCPFIPIGDLSLLWHRVIKSSEAAHLACGVDVKLVTSRKESKLVASYLSKYLAKEVGGVDCERITKIGRCWGRWNVEARTPFEIEIESGGAVGIFADVIDCLGGGVPFARGMGWNFTVYGGSLGTRKFSDDLCAKILARGYKSV
jgi:hypothetical protein